MIQQLKSTTVPPPPVDDNNDVVQPQPTTETMATAEMPHVVVVVPSGRAGSSGSGSGIIIDHPLPVDVLLGKQRMAIHHIGNIRYNSLIAKYRDEYESSSCSKLQKMNISKHILSTIKELGGRFLKQQDDDERVAVVTKKKLNKNNIRNNHNNDDGDGTTTTSCRSSGWVEVTDQVAKSKIAHSFRNLRRTTLPKPVPKPKPVPVPTKTVTSQEEEPVLQVEGKGWTSAQQPSDDGAESLHVNPPYKVGSSACPSILQTTTAAPSLWLGDVLMIHQQNTSKNYNNEDNNKNNTQHHQHQFRNCGVGFSSGYHHLPFSQQQQQQQHHNSRSTTADLRLAEAMLAILLAAGGTGTTSTTTITENRHSHATTNNG